MTGWGAFSSSGQEAFGFWTEDESSLHINVLESKAVLFSFLSFFRDVSDTSILVQSDNKTTIAYINHLGGVKSSTISDIIFELYEFCLPRNIIIKASYLKGDLNKRADALSRQEKDPSFSLPLSLFHYFCDQFSLSPHIDLFASRLNKKLDLYYSKGPDPYSAGFNALVMNWNGVVYAFPPIKLVGTFINKFIHDNAQDALLISPFWPSQPYFTNILGLLANNPILFPVSMLVNASQTPRNLSWFLASHITSQPEKALAFQRRLSPACYGALKPPLLSSTVRPGELLEIGVIHNKSVIAHSL